jgi:hypothetical protein
LHQARLAFWKFARQRFAIQDEVYGQRKHYPAL